MLDKIGFEQNKVTYNINDKNNNLINKITNIDKPYLLDITKCDYDELEYIVYNLAQYHISKLDKKYENYYIEFSNNISNNCHINLFKKNKTTYLPLITSYTFFNDNLSPIIITNIDTENYKYKEFNDENELMFVFPSKLTNIAFNGKYYHMLSKMFTSNSLYLDVEPVILKLNVYTDVPNNTEYYLNTNTIEITFKKITTSIVNTIDISNNVFNNSLSENNNYTKNEYYGKLLLDTKIINKTFIENMLYFNKYNFHKLETIFLNYANYLYVNGLNIKLKNNGDVLNVNLQETIIDILEKFNYTFILKSQNNILNQTKHFTELSNKYGYDLMYDILHCYTCNGIINKDDITIQNRFYGNKINSQFYTSEMCNWICNEISYHKNNNNTIINIENIPYMFRFFINDFNRINSYLQKTYDLNDIKFNILKILVSKENIIDEHISNEKSFFKVKIFLNNSSPIDENKNKKSTFNIGDCVISCNLSQDTNNIDINISSENNYILVFLLDLMYNL